MRIWPRQSARLKSVPLRVRILDMRKNTQLHHTCVFACLFFKRLCPCSFESLDLDKCSLPWHAQPFSTDLESLKNAILRNHLLFSIQNRNFNSVVMYCNFVNTERWWASCEITGDVTVEKLGLNESWKPERKHFARTGILGSFKLLKCMALFHLTQRSKL